MKKHLAVESSSSSIRFVVLRNNEAINSIEASLVGDTDRAKKEELQQIFSENSFLNDDFENVTLAWCGEKSTIVPNAIFNESSAQDIFELCFGKESNKGEIDYNRISELSVINVFDVPNWIKSFFVMKFPLVVMQHAGSHMIRKVLHSNAFKLKTSILCFDNFFRMTIVKHNALEFYSSFSYQNFEDIIYHMNFALQQKEMTNDKGTIEIASSVGSSEDLAEKLSESFGRISELKKMDLVSDANFLAKSQLLCV